MKAHILLLLGAALVFTSAHTQVITPNANAGSAGSQTFLGPLASASRTYQLLINSSELTTLVGKQITGVSFRLLNSASAAWPAADLTYPSYDIYIGEGVAPASRSLTAFSANEVGTPAQVRSGPLQIKAGEYSATGSPKPFGPTIDFNTPWLYTGGHLMLKIVHTGFTTPPNNTSVDAVSTGSVVAACWQGTGSVTNGNAAITRFSFQTPMPVKLTEFSASLQDNNVPLKWTTATEWNSEHFIVERSTDGRSFITAATVKASGQSATPSSYSFTDKDVSTPSGRLFYRLRMVNLDGSFEFSRIVKLAIQDTKEALSVYPNPATSITNVSINAAVKERLVYQVMSTEGKLIASGTFDVVKGMNTFELEVSDFVKGVYILKVNGGALQLQQRLVRQ